MRKIAFLLATLMALGACSPMERSSLNVETSSSASFGVLPEVELLDIQGQMVSPARMRGTTWALALLSRPLVGKTRMLNDELRELQTALGGTDSALVSLSMDPLRDTPASLAKYAVDIEADGETWMLWTGSEASTYRIVQAAFRGTLVGITVEEATASMAASFESVVVVIDAEGRVRGGYDLFAEGGKAAVLDRLRAVSRE